MSEIDSVIAAMSQYGGDPYAEGLASLARIQAELVEELRRHVERQERLWETMDSQRELVAELASHVQAELEAPDEEDPALRALLARLDAVDRHVVDLDDHVARLASALEAAQASLGTLERLAASSVAAQERMRAEAQRARAREVFTTTSAPRGLRRLHADQILGLAMLVAIVVGWILVGGLR